MKSVFTGIIVAALLIGQCFAQDCANKLERTTDKFSDQVIINSPYMDALQIMKVITRKDTVYFFYIQINGSTINVGEKGAYILFDDGSKFIKEAAEIKADVSRYGGGYQYSTYIKVDKEELEMLSKKSITDVKLFIYDATFKEKQANKFKCYVDAIKKAN